MCFLLAMFPSLTNSLAAHASWYESRGDFSKLVPLPIYGGTSVAGLSHKVRFMPWVFKKLFKMLHFISRYTYLDSFAVT